MNCPVTARFVLAAIAPLAVAVAAPRQAAACSVDGTFIRPSNFELVAMTPAIVVARAVEGIPSKDRHSRPQVRLEIVSVVRGAAFHKGDRISVSGSVDTYAGPSRKLDFSGPRRGAFAGGCTAWDYKIDRHYLMFLTQEAGPWNTLGMPFSRVNEEVEPTEDPWVAAVGTYARIASIANARERRKALHELVARGRRKAATPVERAMADDVAHHLALPTKYKSFADLQALYAAPDAEKDLVITAIGTSGDPAARSFMRDLVTSLRARKPRADLHTILPAAAAYYEKVADPAALGELADIYVGLGRMRQQERWPLMNLLVERADGSLQPVMERALADASEEEAARLADWFIVHPSDSARRELKRRIGKDYEALHKYDMAFALAAMGDPEVLSWAKDQLPLAPTKNRWVAVYAIARSPLPEADALTTGLVARGGNDLIWLIEGYVDARHPFAAARLAEMSRRTDLSPEARAKLANALETRAERR